MSKLNKNIVCGLMVLCFAASVFAGPVELIPEYRDQPNSVHVVYDNTDQGWVQSLFNAVPADPAYPLFEAVDNGFISENNDDENFTSYTVAIPNYVDGLEVKHMRVQLVFTNEVSIDDISIDNIYTSFTAPTEWEQVASSEGYSDVHFFDIDIYPNPDWEWIELTWMHPVEDGLADGSSLGDYPELSSIEIDTISVPEPGTISLLVLGGVSLLKRRRLNRA